MAASGPTGCGFIFPQVQGLGSSPMAQRYAIASRSEAEAYLEHPVLGPRLLECTRLMLDHADRSANEILGSPRRHEVQEFNDALCRRQ
jgi:uncharacterized protein (DUF1810 family)